MRRRTVSKASAARALLRHDMPLDEIRAVLAADDPRIIHRYLELHVERLEERIRERRRTLAAVERALTEGLPPTACAESSA
jgi:DNA-binding transcriptional MerR regulator